MATTNNVTALSSTIPNEPNNATWGQPLNPFKEPGPVEYTMVADGNLRKIQMRYHAASAEIHWRPRKVVLLPMSPITPDLLPDLVFHHPHEALWNFVIT